MRICLVYDHLFPQTIGGTERWLRDLALELDSLGHEVTYLTMRHWDGDAAPALGGVNVVGLVRPGTVYGAEHRTFVPPLRFGLGVWRHLLARGRAYDVVHTAAFPYFPLLAAGSLRSRRGYRIVVDWFEVWTRDYWRAYAGAIGGTIGWLVQRACVRVPQHASCASRLHAHRLVTEGYDGNVTILPGLYAGQTRLQARADVDPELIVYAGRHVKEKRVPALVRGFAEALRSRPALRLELFGDGPERARVEALVGELGLSSSVRVNGRRTEAEVADAMARAACLATASEREGYGLVVVEAAARATPSVVVAGPENAATELVEDGVNGVVAPSPAPADLARSLLRVVEAGPTLRESTGRWFEENAARLTLDRSLQVVVAEYQGVRAEDAFQPHAV